MVLATKHLRRFGHASAWRFARAIRVSEVVHFAVAICVVGVCSRQTFAQELTAAAPQHTRIAFERHQLTDVYYSEGAHAGDIDCDGHVDAVYGPYWFAGPDYETKHEIYEPKAQPRERYADHFFAWVDDIDADGWLDVLTVGFPGTPSFVYRNPGESVKNGQHWEKHQVIDWVSNESPQYAQLVDSETNVKQLVCTRDGRFGYWQRDPIAPLAPWKFHTISEDVAPKRFGHGLGVGDINGDGRSDVIMKSGWYEQPENGSGSSSWEFHPFQFAGPGGADMYAYDCDGDGDNDVITSLAAHEFGLAWFEQIQSANGQIGFRKHLIMGSRPEENRYGLVFSELHAVNLVDVDRDGLKDIVTGKTFWSHHTQSPMWDAGAVVYWFQLQRTPAGVNWVPHLADDQSGIGRQLTVADVNRDGRVDFVVGGMKGGHVLLQRREIVDAQRRKDALPVPASDLP